MPCTAKESPQVSPCHRSSDTLDQEASQVHGVQPWWLCILLFERGIKPSHLTILNKNATLNWLASPSLKFHFKKKKWQAPNFIFLRKGSLIFFPFNFLSIADNFHIRIHEGLPVGEPNNGMYDNQQREHSSIKKPSVIRPTALFTTHYEWLGGLNENGPLRVTGSDTLRTCGPIRVGEALLEKVYHWALRVPMLQARPRVTLSSCCMWIQR